MAVMEFHITLPAELDEYEHYYQGLSAATVEELADKGLVPVPVDKFKSSELIRRILESDYVEPEGI